MSEWHALIAKVFIEESQAQDWRTSSNCALIAVVALLTQIEGDDAWMVALPVLCVWALLSRWLAGKEEACRERIGELNQRIGAWNALNQAKEEEEVSDG